MNQDAKEPMPDMPEGVEMRVWVGRINGAGEFYVRPDKGEPNYPPITKEVFVTNQDPRPLIAQAIKERDELRAAAIAYADARGCEWRETTEKRGWSGPITQAFFEALLALDEALAKTKEKGGGR